MLQDIVRTEKSTDINLEDVIDCSSPARLTKLAGDVVNNISMPICWEWEIHQVIEWLKSTVNLPQYEDCFRINFINGRRLILLENHSLPKIGINNFSHVKLIMTEIQKLFKIEPVNEKRGINLPPRFPLTMYLIYRVPTGPIREATTRVDYFRKVLILDSFKSCPDETNINSSAEHEFPCRRFGLVKRKNVYNRITFDKPRPAPKCHSQYIRK